MYTVRPVCILVFIALTLVSGCFQAHAEGLRYRVDTGKPYAEVMADLKVAISEHNYRVTGENVIGEALGQRHHRAFPKSSVVHFCNLEHAREILAAAPDFLLHMPCKVVVYEYGAGVRIETWLLPSHPHAGESVERVNAILRRVVNDAAR